jgi:hypothetical protein
MPTSVYRYRQECGSGSGLEPDSMTLLVQIRNSEPDPGERKEKKMNEILKKICRLKFCRSSGLDPDLMTLWIRSKR